MTYDPYNRATTATAGTAADIDAGLQSHMRTVYNTMGLGLGVTALTAYVVANVPTLFNAIFGTPLAWVVMLAPLGFLFFGFTPARLQRWPVAKVRAMFFLFAGLMGLSMAAIFMTFSATSITRVFFVTAAMFAGTSLYGYTTKKDLSGMGSFMMMGLIGIVIASIVNLFMQSSGLQFALSFLGVFIFTGLAAWETQMIKETYARGRLMQEANDKMAVMGALSLYLNFINLFQSLLQLMGNRD